MRPHILASVSELRTLPFTIYHSPLAIHDFTALLLLDFGPWTRSYHSRFTISTIANSRQLSALSFWISDVSIRLISTVCVVSVS